MGVEIMDTLQPEAANMSPEYLKKNFGGRLAPGLRALSFAEAK